MRIFDCFMYFDEDLILDARLNILDKYVDFFIIVESKYNHKGEKRSLKLDLEKFKKFKNKIKYLVIEDLPNNLEAIKGQDFGVTKEHKFINNAVKRENFQRNFIQKGLDEAQDEDFILISDLDEIPCLENLNLRSVKEKIIVFKQLMTYYKFNLALPNFWWHGTKGCLKKNLKSPQWLRNVKSKKYSLLRLDILFTVFLMSICLSPICTPTNNNSPDFISDTIVLLTETFALEHLCAIVIILLEYFLYHTYHATA